MVELVRIQESSVLLHSLQEHYEILDTENSIIEFLQQKPALLMLLLEAVESLQMAFGDNYIPQLRVLESDDGILLRIVVQLPSNFSGDPEKALHAFDVQWWLNNCHRSDGTLVFDYEIQDVV
jgi:hypothetical protein